MFKGITLLLSLFLRLFLRVFLRLFFWSLSLSLSLLVSCFPTHLKARHRREPPPDATIGADQGISMMQIDASQKETKHLGLGGIPIAPMQTISGNMEKIHGKQQSDTGC